MKKSLKTGLIICLCVMFISGCSKEKNAVSLLNNAMEAMKTVTTYRSEFIVDAKMSTDDEMIENKKWELSYHGNFEYMKAESLLHMYLNNENIKFGEREYAHTESYIQAKDNKESKYIKANDMGWVKQDDYQVSLAMVTQLSPDWNKDIIAGLNPKFMKEEVLDGNDTYKIKVTLNKDIKFNEAFNNIMDEMNDPKLDLIINIDKETNLISKYRYDMSDENKQLFLDASRKLGLLEANMKIENFSFEVKLKDINHIKLFKLPQEVIDITSENIDEGIEYPATASITSGNIQTQTHLWESLNVSLGGKKFNLESIQLSNIIELGYKASEAGTTLKEMSNRKLKAKEQAIIYLDKGSDALSFVLRNNSNRNLKMKDCDIISVSTLNDTSSFAIEGNIKIGTSVDEVLALYGEANIISKDVAETWTYTSTDGFKSLRIGFSDNVVAMIDVNR